MLGADFNIISLHQSASQGGVFPVPHQPAEDDWNTMLTTLHEHV